MRTPSCAALVASFASLLALALPGPALAQAPPEPPPVPSDAAQAETIDEVDEVETVDEINEPDEADEGWTLYHSAFERFVAGDAAGGRAHLRRLAEEHPGHPAAGRARTLLALLEPEAPVTAVGAPAAAATAPGREKTSTLSRAELTVFQTLHGIAVGAELCVLVADNDCEGRGLVASLIGGGVTGLSLSLALTSDGITPGHATSLNSGVLWGLWNAAALNAITDSDDERATAGTLLVGQLAGLGAGAALYQLYEPTAGEVSMVNSGGIWVGTLALFAHGASEFGASETAFWTTLLLASDIGGVAGAITSRYYPMSRARSLVVDAGGLLGMLIGIGTPVLIGGDEVEQAPVFVGGMVGIVGGLGLSTYLTRDWDADAGLNASLQLLPNADGGATVGLAGSW